MGQEAPPAVDCAFTAVSLFSGAGLSDLGYALAGFRLLVQVERDGHRVAVGKRNFRDSAWLGCDVRGAHKRIEEAYRDATDRDLDLLVATPPCQGMSSSNPGRGRRSTGEDGGKEELNKLVLEVLAAAEGLRPRVIVAENVRQVLTLEVGYGGRRRRVIDHLREGLREYELFTGVVNVADYGIPQGRRRAMVVAVRRDERWLSGLESASVVPWPKATHAKDGKGKVARWVTIGEWLRHRQYEALDAASADRAVGKDPLHYVPHYGGNPDRYLQISQIVPNSGGSAYENDRCPECGTGPVQVGAVRCELGHLMRNRPYVCSEGTYRLVRGFHSSYRRMASDEPARTITTNTSHVGSDFKIHPWEHRVLSVLECADLQTVPRFFDWSGATGARPRSKRYLVRQLIGEAFPPYFTFLHGQVLAELLGSTGAGSRPLGGLARRRIAKRRRGRDSGNAEDWQWRGRTSKGLRVGVIEVANPLCCARAAVIDDQVRR